MKSKLFTILFILTSPILVAQVQNSTLDEAKSDSSNNKFGLLIMEMPFGAKLYNANKFKAQELIDNIKSSCKGKAIFIDFWATWCSPCIKAMPNNKRLYIEAKSLPIDFIYVCTDIRTSMDNWITKISYFRQPGIHIFVNDTIIREVWKLLPIGGGYPTYVFIDANGVYKPGAIPQNSGTTIGRLSELIKK